MTIAQPPAKTAAKTARPQKARPPVPASAAGGRAGRESVKVRLHPDTIERARYWADARGVSLNEYMTLAVEEKVARENGDYDFPELGIQRLNQLVDAQVALSTGVENLERIIVSGFDSLLGLTRGDSYLQDEEDGELGEDEVSFEQDALVSGSDDAAFGGGFGGAW